MISKILQLNTANQTQGAFRKGPRTLTVTRHQEDNLSKATSSLFLVKIIAKLETTQSNE